MLGKQIKTDSEPYVPVDTGAFAKMVAVENNGESIRYYGTGARFLYMGKVMIDPETKSPWARKGAVKIVTDRNLIYSSPTATAKWFETAKKKHGKQWIKSVAETIGGKVD